MPPQGNVPCLSTVGWMMALKEFGKLSHLVGRKILIFPFLMNFSQQEPLMTVPVAQLVKD